MGRSRGGLTTKIPRTRRRQWDADRDQTDRGQAHDDRSAADMLDGLKAGQTLLTDRAYDINALLVIMTTQGVWANVLPMNHRLNPPVFSTFLHRYRNVIERFFTSSSATAP